MNFSVCFWVLSVVWGCSTTTKPPTTEQTSDTAAPSPEDTGRPPSPEDTHSTETGTGTPHDTGEDEDTGIPGIRLDQQPYTPCVDPELRTESNKMTVAPHPIWDSVPFGKERFNGYGVTTGDFNGDGWDDFFFTDIKPTLLLTDPTGNLSAATSFPTAIVDEPIGSVAGDVDGDGDLDLYVYGYGTHNRLWLNDGSGTFSDATDSAGFDGKNEEGTAHASMGDLDGDGDLDLVVGNGRTRIGPNPSDMGLLSQVYENLGGGIFTDRSDILSTEQRHGYNWMFSLVDADGDGDLDMYQVLDFASYGWTNILMRNDGDWTFTDVSEETYTNLSMDGMGLAIGDVNGDGIPELVIPDWGPDSVSMLESDGFGAWYESSATRGIIEDFDGGSGQFTIYTDPGSPVNWEHTTVGMVGAYPSPALQSTTAGNGWMKADSDAFGSQGGAQEYTELISPVIDCSMYPNVVLQFEQQFRRWQADTCIVMTSNDGGADIH